MRSTSYYLIIALFFAIGMTSLIAQVNDAPILSIEGQVSDKITQENLANADSIKIRCMANEVSPWTILSCRVVKVPKQGDPTVTVSNGARFSQATIDQLKTAKVDDIIFFEEIKLISKSGEEREVDLVVEVY